MSARSLLRHALLALAALCLALSPAPAGAAESVVRAVLFYSPTCPHCHAVMTESLPPLLQRYGGRLEIVIVDVTTASGQQLYQSMVERYQVPDDRIGVPTLVMDETVLVGSVEIPERLPGLVDAGLAKGGVAWPDIPGLAAQLVPEPAAGVPAQPEPPAPAPTTAAVLSAPPPLLRDMPANMLALVMLAVMLGVTVWSVRAWRTPRRDAAPRWRDVAVPILALAGLGVAGYLTLLETSQAAPVCGPLGNCAVVQQSPYASIMGIPVGALGLIGYVALLAVWAATHGLRGSHVAKAGLMLTGLAGAGMLFSIYLTFLEPFVIGATCMWCLTSAAVMTALFWLVAPYHGMLVPRR